MSHPGTFFLDDTIAALATAPGRGAIAVIRVSGVQAHEIVKRRVTPWPAVRRATVCTIRAADGTPVDQAVVTVFQAPRSFTGEDMVEIATHGGWVAPTLVLGALIGEGAREATPGEFTRRAVLNGKLDLLQAEAIGDLIDARSKGMYDTMLRQLDGHLSRKIMALREAVIHVEALVAYDIDFPEEDDGPVSRRRITSVAAELAQTLDVLLATAPVGELVRVGAVVVIAGPSNVGKSSLFNAVLGANRAIVTDIPGTTRDAIEAVIDVGTWPVRLVDTAGLRETQDIVEQIGIEVSRRYLAEAAVVLACGDNDRSIDDTIAALGPLTSAPVIGVHTKADLSMPSCDGGPHGIGSAPGASCIPVSVVTGRGLDTLLTTVAETLARQHGAPALDAPLLTRERHRHAVGRARDEVTAFVHAWEDGCLPPPVAAVHLRTAAHALEDVIGVVEVEDVLDQLFRTFCVGK